MIQTRSTFVAGAAAFSLIAAWHRLCAQMPTPIRIVVTPVTNYTALVVGRHKGGSRPRFNVSRMQAGRS
jgi:hypothetical protein